MLIAIWLITAILLGLWSLTAWGLQALLSLGTGWTGDLKPLIDRVPYAEIIDQWVPGWQQLLHLLLDLTQALLGWVGGAGPVIVWVLWGVGAAVLALLAAGLTLVVVLLRPGSPKPPSPPAAPPAAAA